MSVLRSGLAGGIAGCVVSQHFYLGLPVIPRIPLAHAFLPTPTGKDGDRTIRPSKDPLPDVQCGFQAVRRSVDVRAGTCGAIRADRVRSLVGRATGLYHAMKAIMVAQGARGLFQGHLATLIRIFPYAGVKFMAYDKLDGVSRGGMHGLRAGTGRADARASDDDLGV
jgi:hypothetical protein